MNAEIEMRLFRPRRLWRVEEILAGTHLDGDRHGLYAWYFKGIPKIVPTAACHRQDGFTALYVGIAPNGPASHSTLKRRIHNHCSANASRSTLRMTVGTVLGFHLWRGVDGRWTFAADEQRLTEWLTKHARLCWAPAPAPWTLERLILISHDLPFNIVHNGHHPFVSRLRTLRRAARRP